MGEWITAENGEQSGAGLPFKIKVGLPQLILRQPNLRLSKISRFE